MLEWTRFGFVYQYDVSVVPSQALEVCSDGSLQLILLHLYDTLYIANVVATHRCGQNSPANVTEIYIYNIHI